MTEEDLDHDIFISFSSLDSATAVLLCERLERDGLKCWISLRDVKPGQNYQAAIVEAIKHARIMVLVFSSNADMSTEISKELSLASAFKTTVIPVRATDVQPHGAFLYELSTRQWINAFDNWDHAMDTLVRTAQDTMARERPGGDHDHDHDHDHAAGHAPEHALSGSHEAGAALRSPAALHALGNAHQAPAHAAISEAEIEKARTVMVFYIGPIARVVVRRAASHAHSREDFHQKLVAELPSAHERQACLMRLKAH